MVNLDRKVENIEVKDVKLTADIDIVSRAYSTGLAVIGTVEYDGQRGSFIMTYGNERLDAIYVIFTTPNPEFDPSQPKGQAWLNDVEIAAKVAVLLKDSDAWAEWRDLILQTIGTIPWSYDAVATGDIDSGNENTHSALRYPEIENDQWDLGDIIIDE